MANRDRRTWSDDDVHFPSTRMARLKRWVLLDGTRWTLAVGIAGVGALLFVSIDAWNVFDIGRRTTPMLYFFSALVGGNLTLITIVVTISQLILARELRTPRELRTELESAEEYRASVEEDTGRPDLPELPAEFLRVLLVDTRRQIEALDSAVSDPQDAALSEELEELTSILEGELDRALEQLETSEDGVFPALSTVLDANFSTRLNHSRWIRGLYEESLSESQLDAFEGLERDLEQLDVARQYFKTIHIEQELAHLSNVIMFTGLVATLVALAALVVTGNAQPPLSTGIQLVFVPLATGVNLVPLGLLIAHVMRITTVAKRTVAITPFISPGE